MTVPTVNGLEQFDAGLNQSSVVKAPAIPNGHYTLTLPDGSHKSFKVWTKKVTSKFAPGKRVMAILIGPDNTEDWLPFAFVDEAGVHVWASQGHLKKYVPPILALLEGAEVTGYGLVLAKHCIRCGRLLTTPRAIELGIGPECERIMDERNEAF